MDLSEKHTPASHHEDHHDLKHENTHEIAEHGHTATDMYVSEPWHVGFSINIG